MKTIITPHESHIEELFEIAKKATCTRSKCGSILISDSEIIGRGYNSQPCEETKSCFKDTLSTTFKSDKTCCIHAEQRAIMDALKSFPEKVKGSTLLFIRLDEKDNPKHSGEPYCTICSKMALDAGVRYFVLWHKEGWTAYETDYYNTLSFKS